MKEYIFIADAKLRQEPTTSSLQQSSSAEHIDGDDKDRVFLLMEYDQKDLPRKNTFGQSKAPSTKTSLRGWGSCKSQPHTPVPRTLKIL